MSRGIGVITHSRIIVHVTTVQNAKPDIQRLHSKGVNGRKYQSLSAFDSIYGCLFFVVLVQFIERAYQTPRSQCP